MEKISFDIPEAKTEKSESISFAESISERLNSEQFIEKINQFPEKYRDAIIGIAIEYNVLHPDGFGFEECMSKLLQVDRFEDMGNEEETVKIYVDSVAKKLGFSEPFSEDDKRTIYEYISKKTPQGRIRIPRFQRLL